MKRKKQIIFEKACNALLSLGAPEGIYICPICLDPFERKDLSENTLTLEHAPPMALGGKGVILTCKYCNNMSGHVFDAHAAKRKIFDKEVGAFISGNIAGRVGHFIFDAEGSSLNANASSDGKGIQFEIPVEQNNPEAIALANERLKGIGEGSEIKVKYARSYNLRLSKISDIKSCYLIVCAKFGFRVALDKRMNRVRDQIRMPYEEVHNHIYLKNAEMPSNRILIDEKSGVALFSFADRVHALPWPSQPYSHFVDYFSVARSLKISGSIFEFPIGYEGIADYRK